MSRMSTPSRRMAPSVTSWNRRARAATVDLPLPVPPMMAVVSPRRQVKDRFRRVYSSASAKRKETSWKVSTSRTPWMSWGASRTRSVISGSWSSTWRMRSQHSRDRGRMRITIWAIMRKKSTSRAYWVTAVMSPIWKAPAWIRPPLSQ